MSLPAHPPDLAAVTAMLERNPGDAQAWRLKGLLSMKSGDYGTAIASLNQALKLKPDFAEACFELACVLEETGPIGTAIKTYQYLGSIAPEYPQGKERLTALQATFQKMLGYFHEGTVFANSGDMENAAAAFRRALEVHPRVPDALSNLGLALYHLRRLDEAQAALLEALRLQPGHIEALATLGSVYHSAGLYDQAIATYRQAVVLDPNYFRGWANLGKILMKTGDDAGAVAAFEEARRIDPHHAEVLAELTHRLHHLCRWERSEVIQSELVDTLGKTRQSASPFIVTLYAPAQLQLENARRWAAAQFPNALSYDGKRPLPAAARGDGKLRIGYLSADFHRHATTYLMSELFEQHDRNRFGVFAYSCGTEDGSPERRRIIRAVDGFRDIRLADNRSANEIIRQDGIDILVDLKGYTHNDRMDLLALRPAPLQMHYLGFPATTGAPFMDYFIADHITAPASADTLFSERLIRLPHCYQINDRKRPLPAVALPREAYGLPETGFVFCGFNQSYKITPAMYDVWMRLLAAIPGSVLWLYEQNAEATMHLKSEAGKRGIDAARIVMAPTAPLAEHLARYRHADLFLDTFPVCGHTTVSDALWCATPPVTIAGESFISRVATSLLHAVGLPELVAPDIAAYEALALSLAQNPERLITLRRHLENGRMHFTLFDSAATTRALESAYEHAAFRHRDGLNPQAFAL